MKKTILQKRLEKASESAPHHEIALDMGISPSQFLKMKNLGHVPKQKRVQKAVEKYLSENGL